MTQPRDGGITDEVDSGQLDGAATMVAQPGEGATGHAHGADPPVSFFAPQGSFVRR
jgi:hypothetical protein